MKTKTVVIITALLCLAVLGLGLILAPDKLAVLPYGLYFGWSGVACVALAARSALTGAGTRNW